MFMGFTRSTSSQCGVGPSGGGEGGNHSGWPLQSGFSLLSWATLFSWHDVAEGLPPWGWLGVSPPVRKRKQLGFCWVFFPSCYVLLVARVKSVLLARQTACLLGVVNHASP